MQEKKADIIDSIPGIFGKFQASGKFASAKPFGSGNINDTYLVETCLPNGKGRYVLQRINRRVFKSPGLVMENMFRIASRLRDKGWDNYLAPLPGKDGQSHVTDMESNAWRLCPAISPAISYDVVSSPAMAEESARAFARFQKDMADIPSPPLHVTLPGFHHTDKVFRDFSAAAAANPQKAQTCLDEIGFARGRENLSRVLSGPIKRGDIPLRVCHNDTKISNVIFHPETGKALCITDLDTVMPGCVLHDFGDLVRAAVSPVPEDHKELKQVQIRMDIFTAIVKGYLSVARVFLTTTEQKLLVTSARVITYELGTRFLTDHLNGNLYFKAEYPDHNLTRARNQFHLLECMELHEKQMEETVARFLGRFESDR